MLESLRQRQADIEIAAALIAICGGLAAFTKIAVGVCRPLFAIAYSRGHSLVSRRDSPHSPGRRHSLAGALSFLLFFLASGVFIAVVSGDPQTQTDRTLAGLGIVGCVGHWGSGFALGVWGLVKPNRKRFFSFMEFGCNGSICALVFAIVVSAVAG